MYNVDRKYKLIYDRATPNKHREADTTNSVFVLEEFSNKF